jgi:phosphoglycolate phosphatase-like HAD superfamily hydrolase
MNKFNALDTLVLWDIDGTLLKSRQFGSNSRHLEAVNQHFSNLKKFKLRDGLTDSGIVEEILILNKIKFNKSELYKIIKTLNELSALELNSETIEIIDVALNGIKLLHKSGFTQGIQTSNTRFRTYLKLEKINVLKYFNNDFIFTSDKIKDKENLLDKHFSKISKFRNVIIIGDTYADYKLALKNKLNFILISDSKKTISEIKKNNKKYPIDYLKITNKFPDEIFT